MDQSESKRHGESVNCACGGTTTINRDGEAYCRTCARLWQADELQAAPVPAGTPGYAMRNGTTWFPQEEAVGFKSD